MATISEQEKLRRREVNASVVGTNALEGLTLDRETLGLMRRFEEGEFTRQELSAAIDRHVQVMAEDLACGAESTVLSSGETKSQRIRGAA